jgi:hypothetical protein
VESEGIGAKGQGTANGTQSARFVSYFVPWLQQLVLQHAVEAAGREDGHKAGASQ